MQKLKYKNELPRILAGGEAFKLLKTGLPHEHKKYTSLYSRELYKLMDKYLQAAGLEKKTHRQYNLWFENTECNVREAFLVRKKRKSENEFVKTIECMRTAMAIVLAKAIEENRDMIFLFEKRDVELSNFLNLNEVSK